MGKFLQRVIRYFHLGEMPGEVRAQMESEGGLMYLAEGVWETAIFRDFSAPGIYCAYRRIGFVGYFALSERRMVVRARCYDQININVAYDDVRFKNMVFAAREECLSVTFDPADHMPDASGRIEIRVHLPDVPAAASILEQRGACIAAGGAMNSSQMWKADRTG
jgi:hypothetical protein